MPNEVTWLEWKDNIGAEKRVKTGKVLLRKGTGARSGDEGKGVAGWDFPPWGHIEDWELKGRDVGSEVTCHNLTSGFRVGSRG